MIRSDEDYPVRLREHKGIILPTGPFSALISAVFEATPPPNASPASDEQIEEWVNERTPAAFYYVGRLPLINIVKDVKPGTTPAILIRLSTAGYTEQALSPDGELIYRKKREPTVQPTAGKDLGITSRLQIYHLPYVPREA